MIATTERKSTVGTIDHIVAANGAKLTIVTRINDAGDVTIKVFAGPDKTAAPVMQGDFLLKR